MKKRRPVFAFLLIVSVAAAIAYNYVTLLERPNAGLRLELHNDIIKGEAASPYNYHVLVPITVEAVSKVVSYTGLISHRRAWGLSYAAYDFLAIALFLCTMYLFLMEWHRPAISLAGVLFCAALLPLGLRDHYFQPWSLIEAWIFCAAFLATYRGQLPIIMLLTILGSFNRITGLFIPFIYVLGTIQTGGSIRRIGKENARTLLRFAGLLALSLSIAAALRFVQGDSEHVHSLLEIWNRNTSPKQLLFAAIHVTLFLGAGWIMVIFGLRSAPVFLRRQMILVLLYCIPVLIYGAWMEVRLLMPLYPILAALLLFPLEKQLSRLTDGEHTESEAKR